MATDGYVHSILVYVSGEGVLGMDMEAGSSIADLKAKVKVRAGIPISRQIIMFEDQELIDERIFSASDLQEQMGGKNMVTVVQHVCSFPINSFPLCLFT